MCKHARTAVGKFRHYEEQIQTVLNTRSFAANYCHNLTVSSYRFNNSK